jgi:histidine triad (HIT) family protein
MADCIFSKILEGEIPSEIVYEDDRVAAFRDVNPQAPVHILIIPKRHIASLDEVTESEEDRDILGYLLIKTKAIAKALELDEGYRVVCNCGAFGQQTVQHLHFHLLGKRQMSWPPG